MRIFVRRSIAFSLTWALAGAVFAQQGTAQQAQPRPPFPGASMPLFHNPDVRRDVKITDQQFERLNQAQQKVLGQFRDQIGALDRLNERERAARAQELSRTFNTELMKASGDILAAQQMTRLQQLELQQRGFETFTDANIQKRLNLTNAQLESLRSLSEVRDRGVRSIQEDRKLSRDDAIRRFDDLQKGSLEKLNTILNEEQRKTWSELTGNRFPFRPDFGSPNR